MEIMRCREIYKSRLSINQTVLIEQPLSLFAQDDDGEKLKYREKHTYVKLNLATGFIKFSKHKTSFIDLDANEPVNIEIALGSHVSNESVQLTRVGHKKCHKKHKHKIDDDHDRHEGHHGHKMNSKDVYIYDHKDWHNKQHADNHEKSDDDKHRY